MAWALFPSHAGANARRPNVSDIANTRVRLKGAALKVTVRSARNSPKGKTHRPSDRARSARSTFFGFPLKTSSAVASHESTAVARPMLSARHVRTALASESQTVIAVWALLAKNFSCASACSSSACSFCFCCCFSSRRSFCRYLISCRRPTVY